MNRWEKFTYYIGVITVCSIILNTIFHSSLTKWIMYGSYVVLGLFIIIFIAYLAYYFLKKKQS
ncbi:hypothetical protein A2V49_00635 [candidate division WWE3 bacterium RBG_19FT_COMBO_34_6]|uniref:Uncharacterized protein n=1 Tax=candidate division WWE3 bacterium RBG_19FT_COMBO_34_6 TaxID=1802612 RepID=A0A1F4UNL2_UNCKA|nr:MAG: hypothetical protein A2V49_00635 [candidate division WWE3 bacterium RBG_19FT_COMBO_34_6]